MPTGRRDAVSAPALGAGARLCLAGLLVVSGVSAYGTELAN
jgi:hypothetical protein